MSLQSLLVKIARTTVVYWAPEGYTGTGGRNYAAGVELLMRWEEKNVLFKDQAGEEIVSQAVAMPLVDLAVDGWLFKGTLAELPPPLPVVNPEGVVGCFKIKQFAKIPDIKSTTWVRRAFL